MKELAILIYMVTFAGHYYASLDLKKATWQYDTDVEFVYS